MIGIGLEELGVEQFVEGKFFDGELFIDTKKQCYKDLELPRMSFFATIGKLLSKVSRDRYSASKKLGGDMKGDGYQNGGTIVVEKGGKLLLSFVQQNPAEHVEPSEVLKALNIAAAAAPAAASAEGSSVDND